MEDPNYEMTDEIILDGAVKCEKTEPKPLIPQLTENFYPDMSPFIRSSFQKALEDEPLSDNIARNLQVSGLNKNLLSLSATANEARELYEIKLDDICRVEKNMMQLHADFLVKEHNSAEDRSFIEKAKLRPCVLFEKLDENIVKKYNLIKADDLLPGTFKELTGSSVKSVCFKPGDDKHKAKPELFGIVKPRERISKRETRFPDARCKRFVIEPESVVFRGYEVGQAYEKFVKLINVGNCAGRFSLQKANVNSRFVVSCDTLPSNYKLIAPGMSVRLRVQFFCNSLETGMEKFEVYVDGGKTLTLKIATFRKPPVLISVLSAASDGKFTREKILSKSIECGTCWVGQAVILTIPMINIVERGRFWVLSKDEWLSASLHLRCTSNTICVPPFSIQPRYFEVNKDEIVTFTVTFMPEKDSLYSEVFVIVSDSCSFEEVNIIGDAFRFRYDFIQLPGLEKTVAIDMDMDEDSRYFINLDGSNLGNLCSKSFRVLNTSSIGIQYVWTGRMANVIFPTTNDFTDVQHENVIITPQSGIINPNTFEEFSVSSNLTKCLGKTYRTIKSLIVRNIPNVAIQDQNDTCSFEMTGERGSLDLLVAEIELWVKPISLKAATMSPPIVDIRGAELKFGSHFSFSVNVSNNSTAPLQANWKCTNDSFPSCTIKKSTAVFEIPVQSNSLSEFTVTATGPGNIVLKETCIFNDKELIHDFNFYGKIEDPFISASKDVINFGLVETGTSIEENVPVALKNSKETLWKIDELKFDPKTRKFLFMHNGKNNSIDFTHTEYSSNLMYKLCTAIPRLWSSLIIINASVCPDQTFIKSFVAIVADVFKPVVSVEVLPRSLPILAPRDILYVGVETKYTIKVCNFFSKAVEFSWKNKIGCDSTKLDFSINPIKGTIPPFNTTLLEAYIIPLSTGCVRHFFVPCFIGNLETPVILSVLCNIRNLSVTFTFPSQKEILKKTVDEEDLNGKEVSHVNNCSLGENFPNAILYEDRVNIVHKNTIILLEEKCNSENNFPGTLPEINFRNVSCFKPFKQTVVVTNETPIATWVNASVANYTEKKRKYANGYINKILSDSGSAKSDGWMHMINNENGLVILVQPAKAELSSQGAVELNIWIYSDTWGTYKDELTLHVCGLQPLLVNINVVVTSHPVYFPMFGRLNDSHDLNFGVIPLSGETCKRCIRVRNSSSVPVLISWHTFLSSECYFEDSTPPFTVQSDIFKCLDFPSSIRKCEGITETCFEHLMPHFGVVEKRIFQVEPLNCNIPPKDQVVITITIDTKSFDVPISSSDLRGYLVGVVRISDKYSFNQGLFERPSGKDLAPVYLPLKAHIDSFRDCVRLISGKTHFMALATDVLDSPNQKLVVTHVLELENYKDFPVLVHFTTKLPFNVKCVEIVEPQCQSVPKNNVVIHSKSRIYIQMDCILERSDVFNESDGTGIYKEGSVSFLIEGEENYRFIYGDLNVHRNDGFVQRFGLSCAVVFPLLELSEDVLDFEDVRLGRVRKLNVVVRNPVGGAVRFSTSTQEDCAAFRAEPAGGVLRQSSAGLGSFVDVWVAFAPTREGVCSGVLSVETSVQRLRVELRGAGTPGQPATSSPSAFTSLCNKEYTGTVNYASDDFGRVLD